MTMRPFTSTISIGEARAIIEAGMPRIDRRERVRLLEASGRVLGSDIVATADVPPFNRASMDGYAVVAADTSGATRGAPRRLRPAGRVYTGEVPTMPVERGTCMETATGERGQLTEEMKERVLAAETMAILEDIYLPYRPKRRTRATIAREKGLEPLARGIFALGEPVAYFSAHAFISAEKGVYTTEDALAGARDIIAEWINEDLNARTRIRELFVAKGVFRTKLISGKEEDGLKYKDYFEWEEPVSTAPSHRILAMRRGEKEGFLSLRIVPPEEEALALLESLFVKGEGESSRQVRMAAHSRFQRQDVAVSRCSSYRSWNGDRWRPRRRRRESWP